MSNRLDENGFPIVQDRYLRLPLDIPCSHMADPCDRCETLRKKIDELLFIVYEQGTLDMKYQQLLAFDRAQAKKLDAAGTRDLMEGVCFRKVDR